MSKAFDVDLVTGDQQEERTLNHYVPTLFIGLGGTGKDVLMRLRKRFHDHGGQQSDFTKYLIIDTDQRRWWPGGDEAEKDYLPVKPSVGEHVDCPISEQQFISTFDSLEMVRPVEYSWLKPEMRNEDHKSVIDGAGTHRQFGRMAFMLNENSIRSAIDSHARALLRASAENANNGDMTVEQDIMEVVVVTSLAGGTGAGMFLDVCYAVRDFFQSGKVKVKSQYTTLFAVMPSVFEQEVDPATFNKFQRNSYAAMLEMEHYGTPWTDDELLFVGSSASKLNRTGFHAPWKGGEFIPGAGWHSCYLIDNTNMLTPNNPLSIGETYQMISDYLFLDYEQSEFAIKKRSNRCNLSQFQGHRLVTSVRKQLPTDDLATLKTDPDVVFATQNGCTFSSLGLAEINFNRQRVYRAASYRLAEHLLRQRWLSKPDALSDTQYVTTTKKLCYEPEPNALDDDPPSLKPDKLCNRLFSHEGGNYFAKALKGVNELRTESFAQGAGKLRKTLEYHRRLLSGQGEAAKNASDQADSLSGSTAALGPVRERMQYIAKTMANEQGVSVGKKFLDYVRRVLSGTRKLAADQKAPGGSPLARLDEADSVWPPARGFAQKIEYPRACDRTKAHIRRMYEHCAAEHVVSMMQNADTYIGSKSETKPPELEKHGTLLNYMTAAEKQLTAILGAVQSRFDQSKTEEPNQRNQSLFPSEWDDSRYDDQINRALVSYAGIGSAKHDSKSFDLDKLSDAVLAHLRESDPIKYEKVLTLTDLIDYWTQLHLKSESDIEQIAELLAQACRAVLFKAELNLDAFFKGSVIDQLVLDNNANERSSKLSGLVKASAPYLPLDIQSQASMTKNYQPISNNLLGKRAGDSARSQDNERLLLTEVNELARVSDQSTDWNASQLDSKPTTLVLCREVWGVPLQYYDKLKFLHEAYKKTRDVDTCHIDYRMSWEDLPDIRNVDPQIYSHIRDNVENVLFAIIRRTIRCRPKDHSFVVMVPDEHAGVDTLKVGSRLSRIIRKVCEEEAVRNYLKRDRIEWEDRAKTKEWAAVYASALLTYEVSRKEIEQEDDKRSAPIRNCIRILLTWLKSRLAAQGEDGQAWIDFLKLNENNAKQRQDFFEHLQKKGLLIQASDYVPIFEVDFDHIAALELPANDKENPE